jgi:hypothetical protein
MFLLLHCLGSIRAPNCPASCQPSCSPPPSSGSVGAAWFHPFSRSATAPTRSCDVPPLLHHQSWVVGRGGRRQLPEGLHGRRRHAWQPASQRQTPVFAPRRSCGNQVGLVFRHAGFFTFCGAATRRSWYRFPTWRGGFCSSVTGGAITGATDAVPILSMGSPQRLDL